MVVRFGGLVVADSSDALRVLETSHPPGYYLPRAAFTEGVLVEAPGSSVCEFKGVARYLDVQVGDAVVLLGTQGDLVIDADEWAQRLDTISYEVVTRLGGRLPRHHEGGAP